MKKTRRNIKGSESWIRKDGCQKSKYQNISIKEAIYKLKENVEQRKIVLVPNFKGKLTGTSKTRKQFRNKNFGIKRNNILKENFYFIKNEIKIGCSTTKHDRHNNKMERATVILIILFVFILMIFFPKTIPSVFFLYNTFIVLSFENVCFWIVSS